MNKMLVMAKIKRGLFLLAFCTAVALGLHAQSVAINNTGTPPSSNAMLDVQSSSKGILIPRIDYNNRPTTGLEPGLMIYVTANGPLGNNMFYYYNGTSWVRAKNSDDNQTLTLSQDTLRISDGNFVIVGNILNLIGYYKCAGSYTNVNTDPAHCGACNHACSYANAGSSCVNGSCVMGNCNSGFANCDANTANGCEINLNTNASNCGACGNVCNLPNAAAACAAGNCVVGTCFFGFSNCDGIMANGCEVNIVTDNSNCGVCGNVCSFANATSACVNAACSLVACNSGFGNCDGNPSNGCEINLNTSVNNCGSCGNVCNLANATASCSGGSCAVASCNGGFANCDGNPANGCERNLMTDANNCGACGIVCQPINTASNSCVGGICTPVCLSNFRNCDGNGQNGCEINITNNPNHCGNCNNVCSMPNAIPACVSGSCTIAACNTGFANCDGNAGNGCEANVNTSTQHCGGCNRPCAVGQSCVNGVCQ